MTAPDWREQAAADLDVARRQLEALSDPIAGALDATIGALQSAELPAIRTAAAELASRLHEASPLDREIARRAAVERLRALGVPDPARLLAAAFANGANGKTPKDGPQLAGSVLALRNVDPWPEPVDGATLLEALYETIRRYVVIDARGAIAAAAWSLHAHCHDAATVSPLLAPTSPAKRCGKTTLLTVVGALVPRPLPAANLTAAALFRAVEAFRPTLLVDEADTFLAVREELRGLLNSGHTRPFAVVVRTVGDNHEVRTFSTWAPKAIALIGNLPNTLEDRSIILRMRRKARGETVQPLRADRIYDELTELRRKCARWAADNLDALRVADPAIPDGLSDRAADNWRPLLAIADACGGTWPQDAREAALALSGDAQAPDQGIEALLLADLHALFTERQKDRLPTATIIEHLVAMQERPWPEWGRARKPISARGLARILGRFGIQPGHWRDGEQTIRGYAREQFVDAWSRYLSATSGTSGTGKSLNDLDVPDVPDVPGTAGVGW